jgi:predicted TIM-barrel fold metal-dependent hydrolase
VFEKFPTLKVILTEFGFTWLPNLVWRLDGQYAMLSRESPWVKQLPSDYIHEHIRLGSQPVEDLGRAGTIGAIVETVEGAEDILCFSSDYPHFSMDDPSYLARALPPSWHRKVFCDNAAAVFGFDEVPVADLAGVHD